MMTPMEDAFVLSGSETLDLKSVCNRSGLKLAAKTRHVTLLLFIVCAPIAWPLSKVREIYSEEKLKTLIKVQSKKMEEAAQGDILARIADFPKKTVQDMMTPMEDAFVLSGSETLDLKLLVTILEKGYTRIPVFEEKNKSNISTVLNVKEVKDILSIIIIILALDELLYIALRFQILI
ncbi:hypothetical protein ANCCEY_13063 [Ancylostoma ceylanicum]|uniref:CNNM transmembrane domain-containing protein n=1 Tax=Ancylostoma ceylanicum TaxID=53326 RepID=A0A0D6L8C8_9BILA|nr:hypothetical protein ANCCEY_13063 [Ancylostoma ceylanicum]